MLQQFLHDFGYFALFLGTFFEGETILVLAGFLAFGVVPGGFEHDQFEAFKVRKRAAHEAA